jgi:hypothetical protein
MVEKRRVRESKRAMRMAYARSCGDRRYEDFGRRDSENIWICPNVWMVRMR